MESIINSCKIAEGYAGNFMDRYYVGSSVFLVFSCVLPTMDASDNLLETILIGTIGITSLVVSGYDIIANFRDKKRQSYFI